MYICIIFICVYICEYQFFMLYMYIIYTSTCPSNFLYTFETIAFGNRAFAVIIIVAVCWDEFGLLVAGRSSFLVQCIWDRVGVSFRHVHQFSTLSYTTRLGWVQTCLFVMGNGSVLSFSNIIMQSSLLAWRTVRSCLFSCNNVLSFFK